MGLNKAFLQRCLGEFVSTFILMFSGTGAVVINDLYGGVIGHLGIAITFGLVVLAMVYAFGELSGAHMNPAVTVGFWLADRFKAKEVIPYILAQCLGAIFASLLLLFMFPEHGSLGATIPSGTVQQSFVLEIILTFILMIVVLQVSTGSKEIGVMAGIAVGATVLLVALFAGPVSGASINPARSLGPALVSGNLNQLWIYLIAPFFGSANAVVCWRMVKRTDNV